MTSPARPKLGVWLIGAYGGVGTTIATGLSAVARGASPPVALATELPVFAHLPFPQLAEIEVGGHDIRRSSFESEAAELHRTSRVFSPEMLAAVDGDLKRWSANVRPGVVRGSGKPVEAFADWVQPAGRTDASIIDRIAADLRAFKAGHHLDHVILVNVSSSEPMPPLGPEFDRADSARSRLMRDEPSGLPASSLYGLAAVAAGADYLNFTPSVGLDRPGLIALADEAGVRHMGRDGKTGETLMKAVLAPMFFRRHLKVMSWVGHNILGNRDGRVLQDPDNKQGKFASKAHLIGDILGYEPQTLVSIEHIESMGDWKTAWDHIHFEGFLGTKMSLQFIWQGCDSLLAAPLAIDLVRWCEVARRRGEHGLLTHLAPYFKSPTGVTEQDFFRQWETLERYAGRV